MFKNERFLTILDLLQKKEGYADQRFTKRTFC